MRRIAISVALVFVAGCAYPPSKVDLLYGPQLIPPPSTASTAGTPGAQPPSSDYYNNPPAGGTGSGGTGVGTGSGGSGTTTPPDNYTPPGGYTPPDGLDYRGTSNGAGSSAFQPVSNGANSGASSSSAADPFSRYNNSSSSTPPRTFPDDGRIAPQGNVPGTSGQTTPNAAGSRYPQNDVQPDDQASNAPARFVPPSDTRSLASSNVQPVSYSRQVTEPGSSAASTTRGSSYDHDANYAWLRGQLDYSQSEQRWKLRYIPITGETDDFGGSVILSGDGLDKFRSGDFVNVRGQLDSQEVERGGFAPLYHIQQISAVE